MTAPAETIGGGRGAVVRTGDALQEATAMLYGAVSQLQAAMRLYAEIHGHHPLSQEGEDAGAFAVKCLVVDHLVLSRHLMGSTALLPCHDALIEAWRSHLGELVAFCPAPNPKPDAKP